MQFGSPSVSKTKKRGTITRTPFSFSTETQPLSRHVSEDECLVLDQQTVKDLEIFETQGLQQSIFEYCDYTRTEGGAKILKLRMRAPWSNTEKIKQTQQAISFILTNLEAFSKLPSYITQSVENYQREILLGVTSANRIEFYLQGLSIWLVHDRHYRHIVNGVQNTCSVIRSLRAFLAQPGLNSPDGELKDIFQEMRDLLDRPRIAEVPDKEIGGGWPPQILRLDQTFRLFEKNTLLRLLQLIYETDSLAAMARATEKNNLLLPEILDGDVRVQAKGLVHPQLAQAVPNSLFLDQKSRILFLTGPNMAGKTTYLRAIATSLYLGHLGMGVPATSFAFAPAQRLFSSLSLSDDLNQGISYFRAEALRVKAVAKAVADNYKVIALMDEPFKGTNVKDAFDASLAVLQLLASKHDCLFAFSSHLIELDNEFDNEQFSRCYFAAEESLGRLQFDYLLKKGVSNQRLGVRVLEEEGVFELLRKSSEATEQGDIASCTS